MIKSFKKLIYIMLIFIILFGTCSFAVETTEQTVGQQSTEATVQEEEHKMTKNVVLVIRETIALWFYILRFISAIVMLVILVVLGIKLAITTLAEKKAAYKKMLIDWVVGFIIIFSIHYIMIFVVTLNQAGINLIKDTANNVYSQDKRVYVIEDESQYGSKNYQSKTNEDIEVSLYESVRTRAFDAKLTNGCIGMVLYGCLVYFAYKFTFVYLKRLLNIAILTIMAPIVGLSFAFNKIMTGKATIFGKWLKEYVTVVLIQFFHALVYVTFVMGTLKIALTSVTGVIFVLILLKYMSSAEGIARKIFGMDSNAIKDLAGDMKKDPSTYLDSLKTGAGVVVGAGTLGVANKYTREALGDLFKPALSKGFEMYALRKADDAIKDKTDFSDENLKNEKSKDFFDQLFDHDENDTNLTAEQEEFDAIVKSEEYLTKLERGVEPEGEPPKYQTRRQLMLAKQAFANNPKVILAGMRQRLSDAFDYRTYTERYIAENEDGSLEVRARLKREHKDVHKSRKKIHKELVKKKMSIQTILGYNQEDKQDLMGGLKLIGDTLTSMPRVAAGVSMLGGSTAVGGVVIGSGIAASAKARDQIASDNDVSTISPDFRNNPALSVYQVELIEDELKNQDNITRTDSYLVSGFGRKHRKGTRIVKSPLNVFLGNKYRSTARVRDQILNLDTMDSMKDLENTRTIIIREIENINKEELEKVDARVHLEEEISRVESSTMSSAEREKSLKKLRKQVSNIDNEISQLQTRRVNVLNDKDEVEDKINQLEADRKDFFEKAGIISRSGGIGYNERKKGMERTSKVFEDYEKVMTKEKKALWNAIAEEAKERCEEKNQDPYHQFVRKGVLNGVLEEAHSVTFKDKGDGSEPEIEEEDIIVPIYDLEDCVNAVGNRFDERDKRTREADKDAADVAYEEWKKNYEAEQERRKQNGEEPLENTIKLPKKNEEYGGLFDYKVSLSDVNLAIINAAGKKNQSVKKFALSKGNTNEVKKELLRMISRIYLLDGYVPQEAVDYVNSLDSVIKCAKSNLVASEAAAAAITEQIEEKGKDNVNVDEAVEKVKSSLVDYFGEVENSPLPKDLQKHGVSDTQVIEDAGFTTISNLARSAMNKKLDGMAEIIRTKNRTEEGTVSESAQRTINLLKALSENMYEKQTAEELSKAQEDVRTRLFGSGRIKDEGTEPSEKVNAEMFKNELSDEELQDLFSSFDSDTRDDLIAEWVASDNRDAEDEKLQRYLYNDGGDSESSETPKKPENDNEMSDTSDPGDNEGDVLGDIIGEALNQTSNNGGGSDNQTDYNNKNKQNGTKSEDGNDQG